MNAVSIVKVEWWDAESGDTGWTNFSDILEWAEQPMPLVTTVGRLVFENELWIVLLSTWSNIGDNDKDEGYHAMKIPKLWIKSKEVIHVEP